MNFYLINNEFLNASNNLAIWCCDTTIFTKYDGREKNIINSVYFILISC